jgi:methylated-DNA-[protein]-cysteine S-methyltransferase
MGGDDRNNDAAARQPPPERASCCTFPTPAGAVQLRFLGDRLVAIHLGQADGPEITSLPPHCREVALVLQAYLHRERAALPCLPYRLVGGTPFQRRVWLALPTVPAGTTTSYGALAAAIGAPGGARAVGQALGRNPLPVVLPCHRVVACNGAGGFGAGLDWKRYLLECEGGSLPSSRSNFSI